MEKINVLNIKGEKVSDAKLSETVWSIEPNDAVIYDALVLARNIVDKVHQILKHVVKLVVVEESLGDKKELVVLDKEVQEHRIGLKVELYLDHIQETLIRK